MGIEFNTRQRKTLTAIVDTFVAAVPREDDPTGFYGAKGSDVGGDVAAEQYLVSVDHEIRTRHSLSSCVDRSSKFPGTAVRHRSLTRCHRRLRMMPDR